MQIVCLESPYAASDTATVEQHVAYARMCMRDSLLRGEAPLLSHLLYTQALDDTVEWERKLGIDAGLEVAKHAEKTVVYTDYGISRGMEYGIENANNSKRTVEYRSLYGN